MKTLVITGEGVGNMVESTTIISVLAALGKVDVWAKPTTKGTESILANKKYINKIIVYPNIPIEKYDAMFQTYSANTRKDKKFNMFPKTYEFTKQDQDEAQTIGEANANLKMLEKAGIKQEGAKSFTALGKARGTADVLIHSGAYNASKKWFWFNELETRLKILGLTILDLDKNRMPLPDLASTIKNAKIFIGNDSGPAHISAAVGTKTIIIYGPTKCLKNMPYNSEVVTQISLKKDCSPCVYQRANIKKCGYKCLKEIEAKDVFEVVKEILEKQSEEIK